MRTRLVEVTNGPQNWGKFLVGQFTAEEWARKSEINTELGDRPLLSQIGWSGQHYLVLDLQTGEGAVFRIGGLASADLQKHRIWVCPLFEPFLTWLYAYRAERQEWFDDLPTLVDLPTAPFELYGHRREGSMSPTAPPTVVYTDGACADNPGGRGGWAVVVVANGAEVERCGFARSTTNNRMELQAAIEGLRMTTGPVTIYSDSQYVVQGASKWLAGWKVRGWKIKGDKPLKNRDLWLLIDELTAGRSIDWCWIRGHAGHTLNERCDRLANEQAGLITSQPIRQADGPRA